VSQQIFGYVLMPSCQDKAVPRFLFPNGAFSSTVLLQSIASPMDPTALWQEIDSTPNTPSVTPAEEKMVCKMKHIQCDT
jgi:hypothetical protein